MAAYTLRASKGFLVQIKSYFIALMLYLQKILDKVVASNILFCVRLMVFKIT